MEIITRSAVHDNLVVIKWDFISSETIITRIKPDQVHQFPFFDVDSAIGTLQVLAPHQGPLHNL